MNLVDELASRLGCSPRSIGYAGLKDRHAVTRQWLSFSEIDDPARLDRLDVEGLTVLEVSRHGNKLKLGHLRGNRFTVDLPGVAADAAGDVRENLADLARRGVPNYFGAQRFGSGGRNLEKGLKILGGNPARAKRRLRKPLLRLLVSSVQSEVFNRVLAARIDSADEVRDGDVAFLHANGACFAVEDALAERPRCANFEISPTGPLPGPKCLRATGPQAELEDRALADLGIEHASFAPFRSNPGERRPLRTRLVAPAVTLHGDGLRVTFELERGAFATTVLGELFAAPAWVEGAD